MCLARIVSIASARTAESMPCDSGVEVCHPWVGQRIGGGAGGGAATVTWVVGPEQAASRNPPAKRIKVARTTARACPETMNGTSATCCREARGPAPAPSAGVLNQDGLPGNEEILWSCMGLYVFGPRAGRRKAGLRQIHLDPEAEACAFGVSEKSVLNRARGVCAVTGPRHLELGAEQHGEGQANVGNRRAE